MSSQSKTSRDQSAGARAANREETDPRLNPSLDPEDAQPAHGKTAGAAGQRAQTAASGVPRAPTGISAAAIKGATGHTDDVPASKDRTADKKTKGAKSDEIPAPTPSAANDV